MCHCSQPKDVSRVEPRWPRLMQVLHAHLTASHGNDSAPAVVKSGLAKIQTTSAVPITTLNFTAARRFCLSVSLSDWQSLPEMNETTAKSTVISYLALMALCALADLVAAGVFLCEGRRRAAKRDCVTKSVGVAQNVIELLQLALSVYLILTWRSIWLEEPFVPALNPNFYIAMACVYSIFNEKHIQGAVAFSFLLAFYDFFIVSPKMDFVRGEPDLPPSNFTNDCGYSALATNED